MGNDADAIRFWEKVNKNGPIPKVRPDLGRCWLWTRAIQYGYGIFTFTPEPGVHRNVKAHRWLYEREVGPASKTLDHLCRVRNCVRPTHLEDVSQGENNARSAGHRVTRTHCPKGHSYEEHGRLQGDGYPACRICDTERHRKRRERLKKSPNLPKGMQ